jgi:Ca2+-binding RTX toxin-like protein
VANYIGTSGNDNYGGGPDADHIEGLGGNDYLIGGGGDDEIFGGEGGDFYLGGGEGNDRIFGGDGDDGLIGDDGNDLLEGGEGADKLNGGSGIDTLRGQGGDDWLVLLDYSPDANFAGESVDGGEGLDTLEFDASARSAPIVLTIADPSLPQNLAGATIVNVEGLRFRSGSGDDDITGGSGDDEIYGLAGSDRLSGSGGNDWLEGGGGDDVIDGGAGSDYLVGDAGAPEGNDLISGGDDSDELHGGGGDDVLSGGGDDDVVYGEAGNDTLTGGEGNDFLRGGSGIDSYDGGADDGNKRSSASGLGDRISFGDASASQGAIADLRTGIIANDGFGNSETMTGIESIGLGTGFADQFYGNDSVNFIGGGRADTLMGFGGDDFFQVFGAPAVLDGGAGTDLLTLASSGGLIPNGSGTGGAFAPPMQTGYAIDLAAQTLTDGHGHSGSIAGIERIRATDLDDVLRGSGVDEWFAPGAGSDTIDGRGGIDSLTYAGGHYDYYHEYKGGIFVDLASGQGIETFAQPQVVSAPGPDRASPPSSTVGAGATAGFTDSIAGVENVEGTGLGDTIYGDAADNRIAPGAGNDVVDGRGGVDTIDYSSARAAVTVRLDQGTASESGTGETDWGYWTEIPTIVEADDHSASTDQLANIENAVGSAFADLLVGDSGANRLEGGDGNDQLRSGAGTDSLIGGAGNDLLYFGAALSAGDVADGGDGRDALVLQGNVTASFTGTTLVGIESISLQTGANPEYGDTGNNRYDYDLAMADGNVAAGQQLIVNAQSLLLGEDFSFDGSAESDGSFRIYGGHGIDLLTGGDGYDIFFFEGQRWGPSDRVHGGEGRDSLVISAGGGVNHIAFADDSFTSIESISLNNKFATDPPQKPSYELVLANGNVAAGATLIVNASSIATGQFASIDGSAVHDGSLRLFGGAGNDTLKGGDGADTLIGGGGSDSLTGGAGVDTFRFDAMTDSTANSADVITGFQSGVDKIDLSRLDANSNAAGDQAFAWIGGAAFHGVAGELRAYDVGSTRWIEGDTDGDGDGDFAFMFQTLTPLEAGDFLL